MSSKIFFLVCVAVFSYSEQNFGTEVQIKSNQKVIVIHGVSCSGKTTTRKWLQALSPFGLIFVGFDLFIDNLPMLFGRGKSDRVISDDLTEFPQYDKYFKFGLNEKGQLPLEYGEDSDKYFDARYALFKIFLEAGHNIVVEECFVEPGSIDKYLQYVDTSKTDVYLFGLQVTPDTLKKRGINRDGVEIECVDNYPEKVFDLVLETEKIPPREVAERIMKYIDENKPSAVYGYDVVK